MRLVHRYVRAFGALTIALSIALWSARSGRAQIARSRVPLNAMLQELKSAPKDNLQRERMLRELFLKAGAKAEEIHLMNVTLNDEVAGHNVIVTKPGKTKSSIVIGGHLDKVAVGDGIIDDWSGCILVKNLYQALRGTKTQHTLLFVCFTMEERGLVGSRQLVAAIKAAQAPGVAAMVNFECLGPGGPFIWTNGSDDRLEAIAHRVAREKHLDLEDHVINGVYADSDSFNSAGIPGITFDGLPLDRFRLIHSEEDRFENIVPERYEAAYKLGLEFVRALDRE